MFIQIFSFFPFYYSNFLSLKIELGVGSEENLNRTLFEEIMTTIDQSADYASGFPFSLDSYSIYHVIYGPG